MAEPRDYDELDPTAKERHSRWEAEKAYPLFLVEISGPDTEWAPRPDERFFESVDIEHEGRTVTIWQGKDGEPVIRPRYGRVSVRAVNEQVAQARALSDNPEYTDVISVSKLDDGIAA